MYRYDNFPDAAWRTVPTFPHHFHDGADSRVVSSPFPLNTREAFRAFVAARLAG